MNRYLGWFVLLAYGATGALIVRQGNDAFRIFLLTYIGAMIAVAGLDLGVMTLRIVGLDLKGPIDIEGFSQNHNFFAFQLLMATCAILVFARGKYLRLILLSLVLLAFWFAGSRSGWIAALCVLGLSILPADRCHTRTTCRRRHYCACRVASVLNRRPDL